VVEDKMKKTKTAIYLFILVFALVIFINTASAGITVTDAEAIYEANLSIVIIPTEPHPIEKIFTCNEDALLKHALIGVSIPTMPIPIKEIFIVNDDAAFDTALYPVSIPTVPTPIKNIFIHLEDAKASEALIFPTELIPDTLSPLITNVTITNITNNSATIIWNTDEIADSVVNYGIDSEIYTEAESDPLFVMNHTIALTQLSPGTNYYFVVNSTDRNGNSAESSEYCYNTTGITNQLQNASFSYPINMDAVEDVYHLDAAAKEKLFANGFVVLKDYEYGNISECYWNLFGKHGVSVFITSDALLHIFHVVHDDMLKEIEKQSLYNSTEQLVQDLQRKSIAEYQNTPSNLTHVKEAARRNVVFFTVACKLLNDSYPAPSYVEENVTEYVQKIVNHNVSEVYPGDDYTQYEPRGHYEGDPALEDYFRSMKWLSRRIFRIEDYKYPEDSHIELIQAVMISEQLQDSPDDMLLWEEVYNITTLLVGTADSITPVMVQRAVANTFPANFTISQLENTTNIEKLRTEFKKPEYPESRIIPVPLDYPGQIPPKYIQFIGERYVPDSYVFQQDTFPYIADATRLPKGLEVMATMLGSNRADLLLTDEKQLYPELESQMNKLNAEFENYTADDWTRNVYCNWFYTLKPLLVDFNQSYPLFMQNTAWQDEKLNTALSSWTQLRHDYILYAKQTYVPMPIAEGYGFVEPIPEFYSRLSSLCMKIDTELSDVLPQEYHDGFNMLAERLVTFEVYAHKIVNNQTLTKGDWGGGEQDDIHGFGLWLLGFFSGGIKEEEPTLVADVCTNSITKRVLHEGVGKFNPIIIVYEQPDGTALAGIGFVMSYYEFEAENFNRINDSEWKDWVEKGTLPLRPFWTNSFVVSAQKAVDF
jgi:chitodextrinase